MVVTFLMQRRFRVNPDQGPPQSNSALLIFIRCEPKPKKSEPTSNDKANPTHPLRHRPIPDDNWPVLKNPHQVEQRHQGED
jgi:hypothetical protein